MARRVEVHLVGDSKSLERAFDRAGRKGQQFETRTSRLGVSLKTLGKAGAAGLAVSGTALLTSSLVKGVRAAKEAQVAQARLRQALKASGNSYQRHNKQIDAAIDKTSRLAGLDDEELSEAFSKLVRTTGSVTKATKGMNIASDIARARGVSLEAATKAVEKAYLGSDLALRRLGITVPKYTGAVDALKEQKDALKASLDKATGSQKEAIESQIDAIDTAMKMARETDKQKSALMAIDKAQQKYAGSAEAYGKTAAGAQERFAVAVENLQEKLGQKLLPVLTKLALWGVRFIDWSEKNWPKFEAVVREQWNKVRGIFEAFRTYFGGWVKIIQGVITGDWSLAWKGVKQVVRGAFDLVIEYLKAVPARLAAWGLKIGKALARGVLNGLKGLPGQILDALNPFEGGNDPGPGSRGGTAPGANPRVAAGPTTTPASPGAAGHPGRARGGPVTAGNPYVVGERGRELFVPNTSGRIVPNGGAAGGGWGAGDIVFQIDGREIFRASLPHNQRAVRTTSAQRRGPMAGTRLATT